MKPSLTSSPTPNENYLLKPLLRGHFHQAAFFFGLGACTVMIGTAPSALSRLSAIIYTLCLLILFGTSSAYHRIAWPENLKKWVRKADHSAIFIFIAGTVTPICVLGLSASSGRRLLLLTWIFAAFGIIKEFLWKNAPRWSSGVFYVLMGWLSAPFISEFYSALGPANTWLLIAGGIVYTLGAVVYVIKKPDPYPRIFGFHEIFHLLVVIAGILHFLVVYDVIMAA